MNQKTFSFLFSKILHAAAAAAIFLAPAASATTATGANDVLHTPAAA
jgi:hypothetical protein